jgi:hypothetical protein
MGNSLAKSDCVSLYGMTEIINDTYTVRRTSGEMESGWSIAPPIMGNMPEWIVYHAIKDNGIWRIFMHNNKRDPNMHVCGWRYLDSIYPTQFSNDQETINSWRSNILLILDDLECKRLATNKSEKIEGESPVSP